MILRRLTSEDDCTLEWVKWLNDPAVAQWLESGGTWTRPRLRRWFRLKTADPRTRIFAIMDDARRVGTLKLENVVAGAWTDVGLIIGPADARSRGLGTRAIREAITVAARAKCAGIYAGIRAKNLASIRAFDAAGFVLRANQNEDGSIRVDAPWTEMAVQAWPRDGVERVLMAVKL